MIRTLLSLLLLLTLGSPLWAQPPSTENFVVLGTDVALCQQVADTAEHWRTEHWHAWIGRDMPGNWTQPCVVTLRYDKPTSDGGGSTTFVFDQGGDFDFRGTWLYGRIDRLLDSVVPHEVLHMVFATHFRRPLPRWADEGACTVTEHFEPQATQNDALVHCLKTRRGIPTNSLLAATEYPRDFMAFYAQSYSLADFLVEAGGKRHFVHFLDNYFQDHNWDRALGESYPINNRDDLQDTWMQWVRAGSPRRDNVHTVFWRPFERLFRDRNQGNDLCGPGSSCGQRQQQQRRVDETQQRRVSQPQQRLVQVKPRQKMQTVIQRVDIGDLLDKMAVDGRFRGPQGDNTPDDLIQEIAVLRGIVMSQGQSIKDFKISCDQPGTVPANDKPVEVVDGETNQPPVVTSYEIRRLK